MNETVHIGELNQRIAIMEMSMSKSPNSGAILAFESLLKNCWAKVQDKKVEEQLEGKIATSFTKEFTIRFDSRLYQSDATDKVVRYKAEKYQIIGVTLTEDRNYLKIIGVKRE